MDERDAHILRAISKTPKARLKYNRTSSDIQETPEAFREIARILQFYNYRPQPDVAAKLEEKPIKPLEKPSVSRCQSVDSDSSQFDYENNRVEMELFLYEEEMKAYKIDFIRRKQEEYNAHNKQIQELVEKQRLQVEERKYSFPRLYPADVASDLKKLENVHMKALKQLREQKLPTEDTTKLFDKKEEPEKKLVLTNVEQQQQQLQVAPPVQPQSLQTAFQEFKKQLAVSVMKISDILQTCDRMHLKRPYSEYVSHLSGVTSSFESLVILAKNSKAMTSETMSMAYSLQSKLDALHVEVSQDTEQARVKALEEFNSKQIHSDTVPEREDSERHNITAPDTFFGGMKQAPQSSQFNTLKEAQQSADPNKSFENTNEGLSQYFNALQYLREFEGALERFKHNPNHKRYRMELHKAVAINTISDASGAQLKSKIYQLVALLSGMPVKCGKTEVTCKLDRDAANYCKNLLAEKIVSQGEKQVQENEAAAFPFAAVTVALCSKFADIWPLMLGHFYSRCPYLVPYYPPREEGQSDTEYYLSLGYKYKEDKLEDVTNFLKRMHGFAVLFAAILQSDAPGGFPQRHSHNLSFGWTWMARTLNLEPTPDISATMILAFLETIGHELLETYNAQFRKVLQLLCNEYFRKLKGVKSETGGPSERLKEFLENAVAKSSISPPRGRLTHEFWKT